MSRFTRDYSQNILGKRTRDNIGEQPVQSAYDSNGIIIDKNGYLSTTPGAKSIVSSGITGEIVHFTYFAPTTGGFSDWHRILVTDDGTDVRIYRWYINGTVTLLSTISGGSGYHVSSAQLQGLLVIASSGFVPKKYDGSSVGNLANWTGLTYSSETSSLVSVDPSTITPSANIRRVAVHRNRLYAQDDTRPSILHYTAMYDSEGFGNSGGAAATKGGALNIQEKDGAGAIEAFFTFQDRLVIQKQTKTYALTGNHSLAVSGLEPFQLLKISDDIGSRSPDATSVLTGDAAYLDSSRKYRSYQNTLTNAELQDQLLSWDIQSTFDNIREKALPYIKSENYKERNQLWLGFRSGYVDTEIPDGDTDIRALYHLDGLTDSTANGLTLTATNAPSLTTGFNRLFRDAYVFNGTNQYLRRSATAGTNASTAYTALSVRSWIYPTALPGSGNKAYIYSENSASGSFALYLYNDSGTQKVIAEITDNASATQQAVYTATLTTSTWYELVMTWDGATITLYVNSTSQATKAWAGTIKTSGTDGYAIAAIAAGGASYFTGRIDEVVVWKTNESADISSFYANVSRKNNMTLIYDYRRKAWMPDSNIQVNDFTYLDRNLFSASYTSTVLKEDIGTTRADISDSRREAKYIIPWDDLRDLNQYADKYKDKNKRVTVVKLWLSNISQDGVLDVCIRYMDGTVTRVPLNLDQSSTTVWGDNWGTLIWSSGVDGGLKEYAVYDFVGSGKLFQLELYKATEGLQFSFIRAVVEGEIDGNSVLYF